MKCTRTPDGGLRLKMDPREAIVFGYLVERASFLDTPPEELNAIFQMTEQIQAALGKSCS